MATDRQIEANRQNAQKSTGPHSQVGRDRSRFNAVRHGIGAKSDVLPGEDAGGFAERIDRWKVDLRARSQVECYLAEQAARVSWKLDRVERAHVARLSARIETAGVAEAQRTEEEVTSLGARLFWDPRGPMAFYPQVPGERTPAGQPLASWSSAPDDPNQPQRIVLQMESTAAGCHWLLARWAELGSILVREQAWQSPDKIRAIRLMGRQPLDLFDDPRVARVFLACHALDPSGGELFHEIHKELTLEEIARFEARAGGGALEWLQPHDQESARDTLRQIIHQAVTRIADKAEVHRQRAEVAARLAVHQLAFDDTDEGERLRRHEASCGRTLFRTLDMLARIQLGNASTEPTPPAKPDIPTRAVIQPVVSVTSPSHTAAPIPAAPTLTRTPAPAKIDKSPNEPTLVNTNERIALNGNHHEGPRLERSWADHRPMRERREPLRG